MDFEVAPAALRRSAADLEADARELGGILTGAYHTGAPDRSANPGWAATLGTETAATAADLALSARVWQQRDLGGSLQAVATAYEHADDSAEQRFRC